MNINDTSVRAVMSSDVHTVTRNDPLTVPDSLMKTEGIRHLPVLSDDGDLCGIITQRDLFRGALLRALGYGSRAEDHMLSKVLVKEAMTEEPLTVAPDEPLRDAAKRMIEEKVGCLPVVEGDKLVGILTEGDFARFVSRS